MVFIKKNRLGFVLSMLLACSITQENRTNETSTYFTNATDDETPELKHELTTESIESTDLEANTTLDPTLMTSVKESISTEPHPTADPTSTIPTSFVEVVRFQLETEENLQNITLDTNITAESVIACAIGCSNKASCRVFDFFEALQSCSLFSDMSGAEWLNHTSYESIIFVTN